MQMNADLGFRHPRFSEEFAWLPAWLQPSHEPLQELHNSSQHPFEDVVSAQKNIPNPEDVHGEDIECKCFRLFLSGEGSSPISSASSLRDEFHLCLHLSTDANSRDNESQLSFVSHCQHDLDKSLPLPRVEISADFSEGPHQLNKENDGAMVDLFLPTCIPETTEFVGPQLSLNNTKCKEQLRENFHSRKHKRTDIKDAIELSIAASEALVIQELVGKTPCSEALPITTVLEAALKIKKSRLESLGDDFDYVTKENDEMDLLSDLDDLVMADAYEDIGLSFASSSDRHAFCSDVSPVKDTPMPENCYGCAQSAKEISHVSATVEERTSFLALQLSVRPQDTLASSDGQISGSAVKGVRTTHVTADRLRCHALDVWAGKLKPETIEVPKQFFGETSYLSESADVAPDVNSVAHKHEARSNVASKQIIVSEGPHNHADDGILISQDVQCPSLSSLDLLCSVVPCSISAGNGRSSLVWDQNDTAAEDENFLSTSNIDIESIGCTQAFGITNGECSAAAVQKQSTSLTLDDTNLPKHNLALENVRAFCNESFPADMGHNMGNISISDKINHEESLMDRLAPSCTMGKDTEGKQTTNNIKNQVSKLTKHKKNLDESIKSCDIRLQKMKGRRSPLILNGRVLQHLQTSRLFIYGSLKKKNFRESAIQETRADQVTQPCNIKVPFRKRVCLSDLEVENQKSCDSGHMKCSPTRFSKRSKPDSQIQDVKHSLTLTNHKKQGKGSIFLDVEFLLTGLSNKKEKEIEGLIRKCGGIVLPDIPPPNSLGKRSQSKIERLPIILCSKKLQTTKFLYGCAVKALILKVEWLIDSISAGSAISPEKYMVLAEQSYISFTRVKKHIHYNDNKYIFHKVGIMLHGTHNFCCKFAKIILHGGGQVFKTLQASLQSLNGGKISLAVIIVEDVNRTSRHLRHCASEKGILMMTTRWIVKSLHSGRLLPISGDKPSLLHSVMMPELPASHGWSQEI